MSCTFVEACHSILSLHHVNTFSDYNLFGELYGELYVPHYKLKLLNSSSLTTMESGARILLEKASCWKCLKHIYGTAHILYHQNINILPDCILSGKTIYPSLQLEIGQFVFLNNGVSWGIKIVQAAIYSVCKLLQCVQETPQVASLSLSISFSDLEKCIGVFLKLWDWSEIQKTCTYSDLHIIQTGSASDKSLTLLFLLISLNANIYILRRKIMNFFHCNLK